MNDYITLDGYKYRTPARNWAPAEHKPASVKTTLLGEVDATYGPTTTYEWRGEIAAPVTSPGTGWGTIADLRLSLKKRSALSFSDHYGVRVRTCTGPFPERSLSPSGTAHEHIYKTIAILYQRVNASGCQRLQKRVREVSARLYATQERPVFEPVAGSMTARPFIAI